MNAVRYSNNEIVRPLTPLSVVLCVRTAERSHVLELAWHGVFLGALLRRKLRVSIATVPYLRCVASPCDVLG